MYKTYLREWKRQKSTAAKKPLRREERSVEKNAFDGLMRIGRAYPNLGKNMAESLINRLEKQSADKFLKIKNAR